MPGMSSVGISFYDVVWRKFHVTKRSPKKKHGSFLTIINIDKMVVESFKL